MRLLRIAPALILLILALCTLAFVAYQPGADAATTFTVNSAAATEDDTCTPDPGGCTLPDAIAAANATGGADIIHFSPSIFPPNNSGPEIMLTGALPTVNATDGITIDGTGAGVKINGGPTASYTGFNIQSGTSVPAQNVTIANLTFTGQYAAAIYVCGGLSPSCYYDISGLNVHDITVELATYGIHISGSSLSGVTLQDNSITSGYASAIYFGSTGPTSNIEIAGNNLFHGSFGVISFSSAGQASHIHIHDNDVSAGAFGIYYLTVGGDDASISHNTIHDSNLNSGLAIGSFFGFEDTHVTVSRNSFYNNALTGIDIEGNGVTPNDTGDGDIGGNDLLNFPIIAASDAQSVTGSACANCKIELFVSDNDPSGYGEGQTFLADATASGSGDFSVPICGLGLAAAASVTTTATDSIGNTSEFSLNFSLSAPSGTCPTPSPTPTHSPTPTPSPTPSATPTPSPTQAPGHKQGDLNCNNVIDGRDALRPIRAEAGLPMTKPPGCPDLTDFTPQFGDVNCDGAVDSGDTVTILKHTGGLPGTPPPPTGCTPIGAMLG